MRNKTTAARNIRPIESSTLQTKRRDLKLAIDKAGETNRKIRTLLEQYKTDRVEVMRLLAACKVSMGTRVNGHRYTAHMKLQSKSVVNPQKVMGIVGLDITLSIAKITKSDALDVLTADQLTTVVESVPATKPTLIIERQKGLGGIDHE